MAWRNIDVDQLITADLLTRGHAPRTLPLRSRPITRPLPAFRPIPDRTQRARAATGAPPGGLESPRPRPRELLRRLALLADRTCRIGSYVETQGAGHLYELTQEEIQCEANSLP